MPQVDLRPLFTPTSQRVSITPPTDCPDPVDTVTQTSPKRSVRFTSEQVTNVAFVVAACLGAIISGAFLFKGGEAFQEVAAWPRELFYGRPHPVSQTTSANNGSTGRNGSTLSSSSPSDSGDPFSPTTRLLNLNPVLPSPRPNNRPSSGPFSSPSNLDRLNMMSPASDALSRGLLQGTTSPAAQTASSAASNAVAASQAIGDSAAQTATVAKGALSASSHKTSSIKTSSTRRLSRMSGKGSAVQKQTRSTKGAAAHSAISSKTSGKTHTSIGSLSGRSTSAGVSQTATNIRSIGGMGHGIGSMSSPGAAGMGGGFGGGHSFGRAGGR